jgi:hypothetical protein
VLGHEFPGATEAASVLGEQNLWGAVLGSNLPPELQ